MIIELQLKREHLPVQQLKEWENQVRMLTDCENPSSEVPRLVWRRDVRLGVNHELHTVRLPFCASIMGKQLMRLFCKDCKIIGWWSQQMGCYAV